MEHYRKEGKIEISKEGEKTTITYGGNEIPAWLSDLKGFKVKNNILSKQKIKFQEQLRLKHQLTLMRQAKF